MDFATEIRKNSTFREQVEEIERLEIKRVYCRHGMAHLMDVCRLAWSLCLEDLWKTGYEAEYGGIETENFREPNPGDDEELGKNSDRLCFENLGNARRNIGGEMELAGARDRIFVAGLLHDIGRGAQYKTGEHHAGVGARLAEEILTQIGYPQAWKEETVEIIRLHCGRHRHLPDGVARENLRQLFDGNECENDVRKMVIADYICRADHLSRPCFCCPTADTCKWTDAERNQVLR